MRRIRRSLSKYPQKQDRPDRQLVNRIRAYDEREYEDERAYYKGRVDASFEL